MGKREKHVSDYKKKVTAIQFLYDMAIISEAEAKAMIDCIDVPAGVAADDIFVMDIDELSVRTRNCLKRSGILTIRELSKKSKQELLLIRNMGSKSYTELMEYIEKNNIQLKEELKKR